MAKKRVAAKGKTEMNVVDSGYSEGGASTTSNILRAWNPQKLSSKSDIDWNLKTLRNRAADEATNTPVGAAAVYSSVTHAVGTGLQLFHELRALLHDGKVGSEVGIIHNVHPETAQRSNQLACHRLVSRHAEFLRHTDTHAGSVLDDDLFVRIMKHRPHLGDLAVDDDRSGGADGGTLAATDAACINEHLAEAGGDNCLLAAFGKVNRADILYF